MPHLKHGVVIALATLIDFNIQATVDGLEVGAADVAQQLPCFQVVCIACLQLRDSFPCPCLELRIRIEALL